MLASALPLLSNTQFLLLSYLTFSGIEIGDAQLAAANAQFLREHHAFEAALRAQQQQLMQPQVGVITCFWFCQSLLT
jgi:hypothetical protein